MNGLKWKMSRTHFKMNTIFIHGPVASGKYTIAKKLSEKLALPLFHNHLTVDLVSSLFEFGSQPFVSLREEIWLTAFSTAALAQQSFIFTFTPEITVNPDFVDKAVAEVVAADGLVLFVELTCSDEEIERRLGDKSREEFDKLKSVEMYRQLKKQGSFIFPALPEPIVRVQTDRVDVQEAIELIAEAVKRAM